MDAAPYKIPQSVLVVIHTPALEVLLIRRADADEYWQSVTGSKDHVDESYEATAVREIAEETGIDARASGHVLRDWSLENIYEIYPRWRWRYAPGVTHNTEHLFSLCVPAGTPRLSRPSRLGTSSSPPSAAVTTLIGTSVYRSPPSRSNSGCGRRWMST